MDLISWHLGRPFKWWYCRNQDVLMDQMIRARHAETSSTHVPSEKATLDIFLQAYRHENLDSSTTKPATDEMDLTADFLAIAATTSKLSCSAATAPRHHGQHDSLHDRPAHRALERARPRAPPRRTRRRLRHRPSTSNTPPPRRPKTPQQPPTDHRGRERITAPLPHRIHHTDHTHPVQTVTQNNSTLPLENQQIWILHYGMGQLASLCPEPRKFQLDRHLPPLVAHKDAWCTFEKGPRACLGQ
jgi:hypothetical protein